LAELETMGRPETLVELLNVPLKVVPFVQRDDPTILLLVRQTLEWVATGTGVAAELVAPPDSGVMHEQRVEIRFTEERRLEGVVRWAAARTDVRLSDFLNGSGDFFELRTEMGRRLVNRQRIREIRII